MSSELDRRPASQQSTLFYTPDASPIISRKSITLHEFGKTHASAPDNVSKLTTSPLKKNLVPAGRRITTISGPRRNNESEVNYWSGHASRERIKLVTEGYKTLALICTFLAGVQAHFITTSNQTDIPTQVVNAFFFAGLFADIGAATLSAASGRWYEMLMPEEAEHVYDWFHASEKSTAEEEEEAERRSVEFVERGIMALEGEGNDAASGSAPASAAPQCWYVKERWLCMSLKAGPYIAVLGLAFLTAGLMVWVWANQTLFVQILYSASCAVLIILLPPFVLPHDRIKALTFFKLQRYSG